MKSALFDCGEDGRYNGLHLTRYLIYLPPRTLFCVYGTEPLDRVWRNEYRISIIEMQK